MTKYQRYLRIMYWAGLRYRDATGCIVTYHGIVPATYTRIERMAASKILGCTP